MAEDEMTSPLIDVQVSEDKGLPAQSPSRIRQWIAATTAKRAVCIAILITLPSLLGGRMIDDLHHQARLTNIPALGDLSGRPWDMFSFADGEPSTMSKMKSLGVWPWWTHPESLASFLRPITVATHMLDYTLWPDTPLLMHAQNLAWYGFAVALVATLYARLLVSPWIAALASLLFAVNHVHGTPVGWLANRSTLLAFSFGMITLLLHEHGRRSGRWLCLCLAPCALLLSLLSKEAGIATCAYLFAYSMFLDRGSIAQRLMRLFPYAVVVVAWRITWSQLGYGVHNVAVYVDPLSDPLGYLVALLVRTPILLAGQFLGPSSDFYMLFLVFDALPIMVAISTLIVVMIAAFFWYGLVWSARDRFWLVGMLLSIMPIAIAFPSDRLLFFVSLGACPLLARFLSSVVHRLHDPVRAIVKPSWSMHKMGVGLAVVHLGLAPLALAYRSAQPVGPPSLVDNVVIKLPLDPDDESKSVVIVTAPIPILCGYLPIKQGLSGGSVPAHTWALAPHVSPYVTFTRVDKKTLLISPAQGFFKSLDGFVVRRMAWEMQVGHREVFDGLVAEIVKLTEDGRPLAVAFHFDVPLEDESLIWQQWMGSGFGPFKPPNIGERVRLYRGKEISKRQME